LKEKIIPIKKKKKNIDFLIVIIILIILFITFFISFSLAKYTVEVNGKILGNIARPIIELKGEESLLITANMPKTSYTFEVRNYNEDENVSEVEMQYYIEIISNVNEAINFELYSEDKVIELQNRRTNLIDMKKNEKQIDKYKLDIIYDNSKGNLDEDIKENIEIKIHSIQKI